MKKFILSVSALAALLAVLLTAVPTKGDGTTTGNAAAAQRAPHQVGLIDMAYVFNNYTKFKAMQDALRQELQASREKAQKKVEEIKALNAQLTDGTLKKDSPEYKSIEQKIILASTELEAYGKITQRDQLRKEAEVYKQIYLEVQDAINLYAKHWNYTLILRFDREDVVKAEQPQEILQRMTRQVVYFRGQDDLTMPILNHLNKQYSQSNPGAAATAPAGGATR